MVYRSEVLQRARNEWPMGGVSYSQSLKWSDGYRRDCSGYVSMAEMFPAGEWGGPNTATMLTDGFVYEIDVNALLPGDLIGHLGEGTGGNAGHVQIFVAWDNHVPDDNGHTVLEQYGDSSGPHLSHYTGWNWAYKAYRSRTIQEDPAPAPVGPTGHVPGSRMLQLATPHMTGDDVSFVQRYIGTAQCGPADGDFGPHTDAGVRWYQGMRGITVDGIVGPQTWGNMGVPWKG